MDDLLSKLTNLRGDSFVAAGPAQIERSPCRQATTRANSSACAGKAGADALAIREGDPGAAKLKRRQLR